MHFKRMPQLVLSWGGLGHMFCERFRACSKQHSWHACHGVSLQHWSPQVRISERGENATSMCMSLLFLLGRTFPHSTPKHRSQTSTIKRLTAIIVRCDHLGKSTLNILGHETRVLFLVMHPAEVRILQLLFIPAMRLGLDSHDRIKGTIDFLKITLETHVRSRGELVRSACASDRHVAEANAGPDMC